ncbi:MAG: catalase family protein [Caulobacter sp.]|nr:catalase family protein [Vitreoscilla sp.]
MSTPTTVLTAPLRFSPEYEHPEPEEAKTLADINEQMHKIQEKTYADGGKGIRSVHAKSHGLLVGELSIAPGLPSELAQGIFARPGTLPVVMRLSTTPGDILPDDVSTPRGMAIKIIGVQGERLPGTEDQVTQDFIMVNGPAFNKPDATSFAKNLKLLAATTDKAEGSKQVLSAALRGLEKVVEAVGGKSATLTALGGHPETNPLGETYYSQVPVLFGEYFGKICVRPATPALQALFKAPVDLKDRPDGLRDTVAAFFEEQGAEWELCVQLCTDVGEMPVEDASVVWDENLSPYRPVARIVMGAQASWSEARARSIDAGLAFNPWHGVAAHRPLGGVMRVRRGAYVAAQRFRAEKNQVTLAEPKAIGDIAL